MDLFIPLEVILSISIVIYLGFLLYRLMSNKDDLDKDEIDGN